MNFFKSLKAKLLGSIKEDLNSALGGQRASFNSKISGALDDLIAMKTGIKLSNIPSKITEEALLNAEGRAKAEKAIGQSISQITSSVKPSDRKVMRFPTDNNRFVDNWIVFRTIPRQYEGVGFIGDGANVNDYGLSESTDKDRKGYHDGDECTIMLYFPNNVKDVINVDYEVKEVGLGDIFVNDVKNLDMPDGTGMIRENIDKLNESLISFQQLESGVVTANPKFNTFQGVSFRNHSYSFSLNPYNVTDAEAITQIIHWFKLMMLPMTTFRNRRQMLMPAEWSIDFRGPILGHIEHPQNCFLTACDVDYAGGKDMSFIESFPQSEEDGTGFSTNDYSAMQHYPNGIVLNLSFQEILNIDRLRYVDRVSAYARGKAQDTKSEFDNFEKEVRAEVEKQSKESSEAQGYGYDRVPVSFATKEAAQTYLAGMPESERKKYYVAPGYSTAKHGPLRNKPPGSQYYRLQLTDEAILNTFTVD